MTGETKSRFMTIEQAFDELNVKASSASSDSLPARDDADEPEWRESLDELSERLRAALR